MKFHFALLIGLASRDLETFNCMFVLIWLFTLFRFQNEPITWAVTPKPVQEEKEYEPEVKTTKAKPTIALASGGNRRFGGHKSTNAKAPVQDNHAQTIEDPTSKPFKRSNRFTLRQNNWKHRDAEPITNGCSRERKTRFKLFVIYEWENL